MIKKSLLFLFIFYYPVIFFGQNPITDSLKKIASRVEKDSAAKLYVKVANIFTGVNSDSVRIYASIADKMASENSVVKGDVLVQFGNSYHMENKLDTAIIYFEKALVYFKKIKNEKGIGKVYQSFGLVKRTLGDISGSIEDNKKALEIYKKMNWTLGVVNIYNNISSAYNSLNNRTEAIKFARLAFANSKLLGDSLKYFGMMSEYGCKLTSVNKLDSALYYINSASSYLERNNMYNLLIPAYTDLAIVVNTDTKEGIKIAKQALLKAKKYSVLSGAQDNLKYIYKYLAEVYLKENKRDSASFYFARTINFSDSLNIEDAIQRSKEIETKYETEKKELQIKNQSLQIESGQKENAAKNKLLLIVIVGLCGIAIFAFSAFKNYKRTKKANSLINEQKHLLEVKQKEIIDSINYAKRLQEAILPPLDFVNNYLPQNFILYKPKDIVAGDFYWAESVSFNGSKNASDLFYIAAADSTGHGVPGALVSVVCSNALNRSLKEFHITETGKILDKARELVIETFEKSNSSVLDGMDISLLCIDRKNKKISWSGANNPLWYLRPLNKENELENKLIEIKGDKQPVGKTEEPKPFTTHHIEYQENAIFYLFTDGLPDQFGGVNGKKFKYKQFSEVLNRNYNLPMIDQLNMLNKTFDDWKRNLEQTDDVCIIGIKV